MRYAKALMGFAKEKGTEDILYKQCKGLAETFSKCPGFRAALENPVLPAKEKFALVCAAAVGDGKVDKTFADFVKLVLKNRREKILQSEQTYWRGQADNGRAREPEGGRSHPK